MSEPTAVDRALTILTLDYVETGKTIGRIDSLFFSIKGWAVSLVSAVAALAITVDRPSLLVLGTAPTLIFWLIDSMYQEHQTACFNHSRRVETAIDDLVADVIDDQHEYLFGHGRNIGRPTWKKTSMLMFARYESLVFYVALLLMLAAGFVLLLVP